MSPVRLSLNAILLLASVGVFAADAPKPQYTYGSVVIPAARADEPVRKEFSASAADDYLRVGALSWKESKNCISCHTTGLYLQVRPALTPWLGAPLAEMREFFVAQLADLKALPQAKQEGGVQPAKFIYIAAGLAEWDAHVTKKLSPETRDALAAMFTLQRTNGTWASADCWPPYESDAFHLATLAAMAAATAPDWLRTTKDAALLDGVKRLKSYLQTTTPPHDYSRVLLLHAATRMKDLLSKKQRDELIAMIGRHQRADGGWSLRTFAAPEAWGKGNRAAKLRSEPEFADPPSDGHMTGYAMVVLREAGVPARDARLRRGVAWLKANQRESGRWWTRSLNTDLWHHITYSGTAFPLLALAECGEIPRRVTK